MKGLVRRTLALMWMFSSSAQAGTPADYAFTFTIETDPTATATSAWRVELTPDAYAWVQDAAVRDIEIFNAAGLPVPIARWQPAPAFVTREQTATLPVLALPASAPRSVAGDLRLVIERGSDGRLHRIDAGDERAPDADARTSDWVLDASAFASPIDRIALTWSAPASGVVARFGIEASDDLQAWHPAGSGTVLVLEQDGSRLERHDIDLTRVRAKYLRLHRLDDGPALAGLAAQAHASERGAADTARAWVDAAVATRSDRTDAPSSGVARHDYVLPSALPVDAARIELANDNALAPLTLSARVTDAPSWSALAQLTAFRLRSGDDTLRNGDVALATTARLREFRIESTVPLIAPPRLAFGYHPDVLVFLAEGSGPYTLAVGSVRTHHATYPVDAALASLRSRLGMDWQPPLAHLGAGTESGGQAALQPLAAPLPWRRWLLWAVLIGAAALVGGIAVKLLRGATPERNGK